MLSLLAGSSSFYCRATAPNIIMPLAPGLVQAGRSLANLAGLGSKLVLGTHDLFEQIRWVWRVPGNE